MDNTLENKAKFSCLYHGQRLQRIKESYGVNATLFLVSANVTENSFLELKPLSQISDEDAWKLASFCGYANANEVIGYRILAGLDLLGCFPTGLPIATKITGHYEAIDSLRSRGYAIPWMGLSVEKLIEYGWIKLKEVKP